MGYLREGRCLRCLRAVPALRTCLDACRPSPPSELDGKGAYNKGATHDDATTSTGMVKRLEPAAEESTKLASPVRRLPTGPHGRPNPTSTIHAAPSAPGPQPPLPIKAVPPPSGSVLCGSVCGSVGWPYQHNPLTMETKPWIIPASAGTYPFSESGVKATVPTDVELDEERGRRELADTYIQVYLGEGRLAEARALGWAEPTSTAVQSSAATPLMDAGRSGPQSDGMVAAHESHSRIASPMAEADARGTGTPGEARPQAEAQALSRVDGASCSVVSQSCASRAFTQHVAYLREGPPIGSNSSATTPACSKNNSIQSTDSSIMFRV